MFIRNKNALINVENLKSISLEPNKTKELFNLTAEYYTGDKVNLADGLTELAGLTLLSELERSLIRTTNVFQIPTDLGAWAALNAPQSKEAAQHRNKMETEASERRAKEAELLARKKRQEADLADQKAQAEHQRIEQLVKSMGGVR